MICKERGWKNESQQENSYYNAHPTRVLAALSDACNSSIFAQIRNDKKLHKGNVAKLRLPLDCAVCSGRSIICLLRAVHRLVAFNKENARSQRPMLLLIQVNGKITTVGTISGHNAGTLKGTGPLNPPGFSGSPSLSF